MRKVILALGSFALGVLTTLFFLSGIPHTSIIRQPVVFAQSKDTPSPLPKVPPPAPNKFVPVVPPLSNGVVFNNTYVGNAPLTIELDGMTLVNESYGGPVKFVYGGGNFRVGNLKYPSATVELSGAAANTLRFLSVFGAVVCPPNVPKPPGIVETPKVNSIKLTTTEIGNPVTVSADEKK